MHTYMYTYICSGLGPRGPEGRGAETKTGPASIAYRCIQICIICICRRICIYYIQMRGPASIASSAATSRIVLALVTDLIAHQLLLQPVDS